jgi:hypothetical protein
MKVKDTAVKAANKALRRESMDFFCFVCNKDITIYRTDKAGKLEPQTICAHMAYKGLK